MKSIFLAFGMITLSFVIFLCMGWYIQFDQTYSVTESALKRALTATMSDYLDQSDFSESDVMDTFVHYFDELAIEDMEYDLTLIGFIKEPLFMRVHCSASNQKKLKGLKIELDEAMIEELRK